MNYECCSVAKIIYLVYSYLKRFLFSSVSTSWHTEEDSFRAPPIDRSILPTAPRSAREPNIDRSRLPRSPPYTAFLGNLPYDVSEESIKDFFRGLAVGLASNHTCSVGCVTCSMWRTATATLCFVGQHKQWNPSETLFLSLQDLLTVTHLSQILNLDIKYFSPHWLTLYNLTNLSHLSYLQQCRSHSWPGHFYGRQILMTAVSSGISFISQSPQFTYIFPLHTTLSFRAALSVSCCCLYLQISAVRLPREPSNPERLKGFGYAEFDDVDSLLRALSLNEEVRGCHKNLVLYFFMFNTWSRTKIQEYDFPCCWFAQ